MNRTIREYLQQNWQINGYEEVNTPQLLDVSLWAQSGHLEKFADDLFLSESENRQYAVKPMSCPCHVQIFKQGIKSYRDLPIRWRNLAAAIATKLQAHCKAW